MVRHINFHVHTPLPPPTAVFLAFDALRTKHAPAHWGQTAAVVRVRCGGHLAGLAMCAWRPQGRGGGRAANHAWLVGRMPRMHDLVALAFTSDKSDVVHHIFHRARSDLANAVIELDLVRYVIHVVPVADWSVRARGRGVPARGGEGRAGHRRATGWWATAARTGR